MSVKLGTKDLFPYLGDYRPVNIYKGENKISGWKWAEQSGEELYLENTYNDFVNVEIDGKSVQEGELSPDYPIEIHSVNDFDVVSSVGGRNLIISSDVTPRTYITPDGELRKIDGHFVTGFIEVKANEFYTISMLLQRNQYSRVGYYDLDKNFIKRDLFQRQEVIQINPEQDSLIRWSPDVDSSSNDYGPGYKIEKGTVATDWTPAPEDISYDVLKNGVYKTKGDGNSVNVPSFKGGTTIYTVPHTEITAKTKVKDV